MRARDPAARCARVVREAFAQLRAQGMPGAQCARSLACKIDKAHEHSHHGHTGNHPAFPAQWFYGLLRALPGDRAFCHRHLRIWRVTTRLGSHASANLTPASRRQNHTTSPYAESIVRLRAIRQLTGLVGPPCHPLTSPDAAASTASRPAFLTTRDPPLLSERDIE